jgi:hypothetical protein
MRQEWARGFSTPTDLFLLPLEGFVNTAFFTSDWFRFGSTLLGIIVSSWVIISRLKK